MQKITKEDIDNAHLRIKSYIHRTPVLTNASINQMAGTELFFKCENFQKIGAFKIRGGMNASLSLTADQLKNGIATHSSGNHAQAIAFAAKELGTKAYIVMPTSSPSVKVNAVKGYGAEVIMCEPNQAAREAALQKIVDETGAVFIHPYDDYRVITGQATCVKELLEEVPDLHAVIAPVGGGGCLSGTALGAHYFNSKIEVYAGEPEGAADAVHDAQDDGGGNQRHLLFQFPARDFRKMAGRFAGRVRLQPQGAPVFDRSQNPRGHAEVDRHVP